MWLTWRKEHSPTFSNVALPVTSDEICDAPQHARIWPFLDLVLAFRQMTAHATARHTCEYTLVMLLEGQSTYIVVLFAQAILLEPVGHPPVLSFDPDRQPSSLMRLNGDRMFLDGPMQATGVHTRIQHSPLEQCKA